MNSKVFKLKASVKTKAEMEDIISEINNCEFCNSEEFEIKLLDFEYSVSGHDKIGISNIEIFYKDGVNISEKLDELFYCEFCHSNLDYFMVV